MLGGKPARRRRPYFCLLRSAGECCSEPRAGTRGAARGHCALPDATWAAGRLVDSTKPAPPTRLRGALGKSVGFVLEECFPALACVRAASGAEIPQRGATALRLPAPLPTLPLHTCQLRPPRLAPASPPRPPGILNPEEGEDAAVCTSTRI